MSNAAKNTTRAIDHHWGPINCATIMAARADIKCPPITLRGWAKTLLYDTKSIMADEASEGIRKKDWKRKLIRLITAIPTAIPVKDIRFSLHIIGS